MFIIYSYMKKLFRALRNRKGFTLIELLVVIGILGVLAAALIATIDPFEQIKKAEDSNAKNVTVEFVEAATRYYATHNVLPWGVTTGPYTSCTNAIGSNATPMNSSDPCLQILISDGELKAQFVNSLNLTSVDYIGGASGVTACFKPISKSQINDPLTQYNSNGVATSGCPGSTYCYWCSK